MHSNVIGDVECAKQDGWVEARGVKVLVRLKTANMTQNVIFNVEISSDTAVERGRPAWRSQWCNTFGGVIHLVFCPSMGPHQIYVISICDAGTIGLIPNTRGPVLMEVSG